MRWNVFGNTILFVINLAFAQTYILKAKITQPDSSLFSTLIKNTLGQSKVQTDQAISISFQPLIPERNVTSGQFQWNLYARIITSQALSPQIIQSLNSHPSIEFFSPSRIYSVYSVPNDSAFGSQWNLQRTGVSALWTNGKVYNQLPSVIVGIVDTGIDDDHPDLSSAIAHNAGEMGNGKETNGLDDDGNGFIDDWRGYDFVEFDTEDIGDWNIQDNDPNDEHGHGTSVSGIIGATTNNNIGISGIAPARLLPLRAFGKNGNGNDINIASAVVYAVDNGAEVINLSFGDVIQSPLLHDAIKYAYGKNVVIVASSGNNGTDDPHYPSDFNEVISTGSVNSFDVRSFFSSYGPSLDIMAPGESIPTTTLGGGYQAQFSGTSAAAPHISGIIAILKSLERQKRALNGSYVPLTNEELRGILQNSAADIGDKGWDSYTAAGVVNVIRAIDAVSGSTVNIHSPQLDEQIIQISVPVVITAVSPYLESVSLDYGVGENPGTWENITVVQHKYFVRDTIAHWDVTSLTDKVYTLRLRVINSKGNNIEHRQRVYVDSANPKILSFRFRDSVIINDQYGSLVEAKMDRNTAATLFYRKVGENQYRSIQSLGLQKNHAFILSNKFFQPSMKYEFYCLFEENSSAKRTIRFPTTALVGFDHFTVTVNHQSIVTTGLTQKSFTLPNGFLLNAVLSIGNQKSIVMNEYDDENNFGKAKALIFQNGSFAAVDSSAEFWIPRSLKNISGSTMSGLLVQNRGVSKLFRIDTVKKSFFSDTIWGDSSDIWASQLTEINGDNNLDIIARSSSRYLIYKNNGNNSFTKSTELINPSNPLPGDAQNQFGPPKSLIGDFSQQGRQEIIFADYDGDFIMYRQSSADPFQFELAGVENSDLFEMSDYLTSGDYNGDGALDFAVAAHSNMDWNDDREYDFPVWTVKVFSHLPADPAGKVTKIWEQHFVGVKGGSGYDNGIESGKLKNSDSRDALFLSFNPYLYLFEWDQSLNRFRPRWMHASQSNSVLLHDFDADGNTDIGFHTGGRTEFWSLPLSTVVAAPYGVTAVPLSTKQIRIRWSSSSQSYTHTIFRGTQKDLLLPVVNVTNVSEWIDTAVTMNVQYYYAVTAANGGVSERSAVVSAIPHSPAAVTSAAQVSSHQLEIGVSYDIDPAAVLTAQFVIDSNNYSTTAVVASPRQLLVTFNKIIIAGNHTLRIRQLTDASGLAGDTLQTFSFTSSQQEERLFFVRAAQLQKPKNILVEFSEQPNFQSAMNPVNYSVNTIAKNFPIMSIDSVNPVTVRLHLADPSISTIALRIELSFNNAISSASGTLLFDGKGQTTSIAQETQSVDHIVVYPNPARNTSQVSFVNMPANCRITVYSSAGMKIAELSGKSSAEGATWNLTDQSGNKVSSGIYLYRVEVFDENENITQTKTGKFAVIR